VGSFVTAVMSLWLCTRGKMIVSFIIIIILGIELYRSQFYESI
jgi:hypothetical protein